MYREYLFHGFQFNDDRIVYQEIGTEPGVQLDPVIPHREWDLSLDVEATP